MTAPPTRLDHGVAIRTAEPLRQVNALLLDLLRDLSPDEWHLPTVHRDRNVKDLTAHLLHGSMRRISMIRDGYSPPAPLPAAPSLEDLIAFIQSDNRDFMAGMRRVSPQILLELLSLHDQELARLFEGLDPGGPGLGVAWAGDAVSPAWFDVAREYTEKWHHQQQIRDATGRPPLYSEALLAPVLETFARGLPFAYRDHASPEGEGITVSITGPVTLAWTLRREREAWTLWTAAPTRSTIQLPADLAWRLWTKGTTPDLAREKIQVTGDPAAAEPLLRFVAIMA